MLGPTPVFGFQVTLELTATCPLTCQLSFRVVGLSFLPTNFVIQKCTYTKHADTGLMLGLNRSEFPDHLGWNQFKDFGLALVLLGI